MNKILLQIKMQHIQAIIALWDQTACNVNIVAKSDTKNIE